MQRYTGRIAEIQLHLGERNALIACPVEIVPEPGQYLLAVNDDSLQATPLFMADFRSQGFLAAPPIPESWRPGDQISLMGPLGHGFSSPQNIQRLALVALGNTNARLLPLVNHDRLNQPSITLFSDAPLVGLPPDLEAFPLEDLGDSFNWADFFAVDVPREQLSILGDNFRNFQREPVVLRGQVLVHGCMPCSTLADCGICAVRIKRSWKLTCKDGPVFDLAGLLRGIAL